MEQSFSSVVSTTSDNLSKLSRSLRGDVVGSAQYQQAMRELSPLFQPRFFSAKAGSSPLEFVRTSVGKKVSVLPDELLQSIPPPKAKYSLWQGFEARGASLDSCEVRKELAATEIREIDEHINRLKKLRAVAFDQVAQIEQQERALEKAQGAQGSAGASANGDSPTKLSSGGSQGSATSPRRRERRKTQPTLQAFYAAGDRIKSLKLGDTIAAVDFDVPFGAMAAAVGNTVQLWDLNGELLASHEVPASVRCVQLRDAIVAGSSDASLRIYGDSSEHLLQGHIEPVTCVDWDAVGSAPSVVSGSDDKTLRQWDPETGRCIQVLDVLSAGRRLAAPQFCTQLWGPTAPSVGAIQHRGAALAAGTADGVVRLWDLRAGSVVRTLPGHMGPVTGLKFDDSQVVSGSLDKSVRVWDLRTSMVLDTWAYNAPIVSLHLDAAKVVCATGEPLAHVYNRKTKQHLSVGPGDSEPDAAGISAICQKSGYLVEGRVDGSLGVWAC